MSCRACHSAGRQVSASQTEYSIKDNRGARTSATRVCENRQARHLLRFKSALRPRAAGGVSDAAWRLSLRIDLRLKGADDPPDLSVVAGRITSGGFSSASGQRLSHPAGDGRDRDHVGQPLRVFARGRPPSSKPGHAVVRAAPLARARSVSVKRPILADLEASSTGAVAGQARVHPLLGAFTGSTGPRRQPPCGARQREDPD